MVIDNNRYDISLYDRALYSEERILLAVPNHFVECKAVKEYALDEETVKTQKYKSDECRGVPLSAFSSVPFVMLTQNNDTRIRGEKMCKESGFQPNIVLEVHQQATSYMISATGIGATFISDTVVAKLPVHDTMEYYKIDSPFAYREVYFYFKKHKYKTRVMQEFMNFIKEK
jgi:hypothetical protein